ncbi:hypothetical protein CY34DRAFT_800746 [Suillus luteus UH-Slu-Lm8-n1]|uniref:Uncharacterized protein n=1 Tax=Suillus luteus UH-Slu-Lm8-n1 TaxID=930992 RepID=A0A0D0B8S7_9AGAM|nr:hypothetical protein CY34DRAFT_800746 [Suillus luteus UH-Slu-Lm8-n1]
MIELVDESMLTIWRPQLAMRYSSFRNGLRSWSPPMNQQGSMIQDRGPPIATTCQAKEPSAPRKRAAFSYNPARALLIGFKLSDLFNRPPKNITPCKTLPSIFSPLFQDEMRKSADRRILSIEHTRAEYRPNCRPNLHRRQRNTRRFRDITRHYHPLHNSTIRRIVRHCKPAHKLEPCQVTLYITAKITHHDVRSPCVHPPADARSVK